MLDPRQLPARRLASDRLPDPLADRLGFDASTALLVVDVQNDFADPAGTLHVPGGEDVPARANALIVAARAAGSLVAYTQDWHPAHTRHFATDGGPWPVHCVGGTWGAALHPGLLVAGPIVRKGSNGEDGYSGFTMRDERSDETVPTELEGLLRARGVRRVVIAGLATDYCVAATAEDAVRLGFDTLLVADAIRAVDRSEGDGARALERLGRLGVSIVEAVPG